MVEDLEKYYKQLKNTPIARGRYVINESSDADEIQRLLFGLGFKWRSGRLDVIEMSKYQKFIYSKLVCDEISAFQRQTCGIITCSDIQHGADDHGDTFISVSLDQLRDLYLAITGNNAMSLNPNRPQTPFEETW